MCDAGLDKLVARAYDLVRGQVAFARTLGGWASGALDHGRSGQPDGSPVEHLDPGPTPGTQRSGAATTEGPTLSLPGAIDGPELDSDPDKLGISGYDQLAASQIVSRLDSLTPQQRGAVGEYERSHRRRQTVLHRIAQLDSGT